MEEGKPAKARGDAPAWWHLNGTKMRPLSDFQHRLLHIISDSATLTISPDENHLERKIWLLSWEITRVSALGIKIELKMPTEVLCRAFALDDDPSSSDEYLLKHYGAGAAERGYYIRAGNYLNIPGPGTGSDGDPNISILLDDDIQELLRELLGLP